MRKGIAGIVLGLLLTITAHGQSLNPSAAGAAAVPIEAGYVIKFKVKSGKNAEFEKAIGQMMIGVHEKEPGNLYCDLFHLPQDPQSYVIVERYKDIQASKAHGESDYIKKLGATLQNGLLDGPPEVQALVFIRSK